MFTEKFTLDKAYFRECFEESLPFSNEIKPKYPLLVFLILLSLVSWFVLNNGYLASFLILVATLELIAFYYQKPWWVARQMLSRASGSLVTLHFDEQGIKAVNPYKEYAFSWQDITATHITNRGVVFKTNKGMQYVSKSALSDKTLDFICLKAKI
jgi:hypothetical protein